MRSVARKWVGDSPWRAISRRGLILVVCGLWFGSTESVWAQLRLPAVFSDHMILQREQPIRIWGWDEPRTPVQVHLAGPSETATTTVATDEQGRWEAQLPAQTAGGPWTLVVEGSQRIQHDDIWLGDLWLCSGQSNMEWSVAASADAAAEIAAANHPHIRHLKVRHRASAAPAEDLPSDGWKVCSPETVGQFSAVAYYFGRHLQSELDVPIGLIGSNWGGTRIEPWTPPAGFQAVEALSEIAQNLERFPEQRADGQIHHQSPLALYNGMIHPLVRLPIRGVIWYQGESNNGEGMLYRDKMEALITGWRTVWGQPELPFYYVQLAPYRYGGDPARLAGIWEAQTAALRIPHTGMAVTVDIGDLNDIHPVNKQDVGQRLALWALAKPFGREVVYSGPLFRRAQVDGATMTIEFEHGHGIRTSDRQPLREIWIAGQDRVFYPAEVRFAGDANVDGNDLPDRLVVSSPDVPRPVAVRYAFHQEAQPNLVGSTGLPASPFRTDDWLRAVVPVPAAAYIGRWLVQFETPDGQAIEHAMAIEAQAVGLAVQVESPDGTSDAKVEVKPHGLQIHFEAPYQGQTVQLVYHWRLEGDKLVGQADYDLAGETGQFPISATK